MRLKLKECQAVVAMKDSKETEDTAQTLMNVLKVLTTVIRMRRAQTQMVASHALVIPTTAVMAQPVLLVIEMPISLPKDCASVIRAFEAMELYAPILTSVRKERTTATILQHVQTQTVPSNASVKLGTRAMVSLVRKLTSVKLVNITATRMLLVLTI